MRKNRSRTAKITDKAVRDSFIGFSSYDASSEDVFFVCGSPFYDVYVFFRLAWKPPFMSLFRLINVASVILQLFSLQPIQDQCQRTF